MLKGILNETLAPIKKDKFCHSNWQARPMARIAWRLGQQNLAASENSGDPPRRENPL